MNNQVSRILLPTILLFTLIISFNVSAVKADTVFQGWQFLDDGKGGQVTVAGDVMRFWGPGRISIGPTFWVPFTPQSDFQVSLQVKAMRLGVIATDYYLEGFGVFLRPNSSSFGLPTGVNFEMRGS